ncbi:ATP/GTP-binding protein [Streptomyces avidinii]
MAGFVLPKFDENRGVAFLEAVAEAEAAAGLPRLYAARPETPELLHLETRAQALAGISRTVNSHRDRVLALRLGVTDFRPATACGARPT